MYEKVLERLGQKEEILSVNIGNLREDIWERMAQIASWDKMDKEMYREHRAKAIHNIATVLEQYKYLYRVPVLLQPFSAECVQDGYFEFGGSTVVLIFKKDTVKVDDDIINNSRENVETRVLLGQKIGCKGV